MTFIISGLGTLPIIVSLDGVQFEITTPLSNLLFIISVQLWSFYIWNISCLHIRVILYDNDVFNLYW